VLIFDINHWLSPLCYTYDSAIYLTDKCVSIRKCWTLNVTLYFTWHKFMFYSILIIFIVIIQYLFSFDIERYKRGPELKIIDMRVLFRGHYFGFSGTLWLPFSGFHCEVRISDRILSPTLSSGTWRQQRSEKRENLSTRGIYIPKAEMTLWSIIVWGLMEESGPKSNYTLKYQL